MSDRSELKQPDLVHPDGQAPPPPPESLTPEEQDALFDEWARAYASPDPEIEARYAEIGRRTREALGLDGQCETTSSGVERRC